jgi:ATP-dependent Clp protease ATP-binding subunit ClpC
MTSKQPEAFDRLCVDLTLAAREQRLPRIHLRDDEAREVLELLCDRRSVLLVGPPGVGKTAIVNRVAGLLAEQQLPWPKSIFSVTTAQIIATPQGYIGQWQANLRSVLDGVRAGEGALHYADIWVAAGAGRTVSSEDNIWDALEPLIARRELTLLCECQPDMARVIERRMPGMLDRFVRLDVRALDERQARAVLQAHARAEVRGAPTAESWSDDSLGRVQDLTDRFQPYRAQPGKGLALMDRVVHYRREKVRRGEDEAVSPELVERVFSVYSGLPLFVLSDQAPLRQAEATDFFRQHVIGQDQAIAPVVEAIAMYKAGLNDPRRPIASFLFVGPTGVGKTELARTLARFVFGSPDRLLRLDMSEYRDYHGFQMLVGDPKRPEQRALLCDPVRDQPFQVVLFDEFEKGHSNVADLLLQVLDAGRLTTPTGVVVDFSSTIVILTSNLGSDLRRGQIGLRPGGEDARAALIEGALESALRPEFLNRIDRVVHFGQLSDADLRRVARRELQLIAERRGIRGRRVTLDVDDAVIDEILRADLDRKYGARGLRRMLERRVAVPVALALAERAARRAGGATAAVTERLRVRLDVGRGITVDLFSDEPEAQQRPPKPARAARSAHLTGEDSGLRLTPAQARERLERLRVDLEALALHIDLPERRRELERMAEEHARADFWRDPGPAALAFTQYDRLAFQVRRLDRLSVRQADLARQAANLTDRETPGRRRTAPIIDAIADFAADVEEADLELRHFGQSGQQDEADALIRLRPELGDDPAAIALALREHWEIYANWARSGPRGADLLYAPAEGGIATQLMVGIVSGPLAFGYLRREAGQHRFRLRRASDGTGAVTVVVRAEIFPAAPFEATAPQAPREAVLQSYALKLAVEEPGGIRRIRSAVLGRCADGQVLPLQNERDLTDNRIICRRLVAAVDAFPAGGQPATDDPLVRTYEFGSQPLVKDHATGHTTGRLKDVLDGDLDALLRLRIRRLPLR